MANIKLSQLRSINIEDPNSAYIMVVAPDKTGRLQNYRISVSQLAQFIEGDNTGGGSGGGSVEGLTAQQVQALIDRAIEKHEVFDPEQNITIEDKIITIDNDVTELQESIDQLETSTEAIVKKTAEIKNDANTAKSAAAEAINKVSNMEQKVTDINNTFNELAPSIEDNSSNIEALQNTINNQLTPQVTDAVNKANDADNKIDEVENKINIEVKPVIETNTENIEKIFTEIEIIKEEQNIEAVTYDDAEEFFNTVYNI